MSSAKNALSVVTEQPQLRVTAKLGHKYMIRKTLAERDYLPYKLRTMESRQHLIQNPNWQWNRQG